MFRGSELPFLVKLLFYILFAAPRIVCAEQANVYSDANATFCSEKAVDVESLLCLSLNAQIDPCDLVNLSKDDISFIRNYVYAKNGYYFKDKKVRDIFNKFDWYKNIVKTTDPILTDIHKKNIETITSIELMQNKAIVTSEREINYETADGVNFPKSDVFLVPITELNKFDANVFEIDSKLIFNSGIVVDLSIPKNYNEIKQGDVLHEKTDWRVIGSTLIVLRPYSFVGVEGGGCDSEYYSLFGDLLYTKETCPNFFYRYNSDILVESRYVGCCGAFAYKLGVFDIKSGHEWTYDCDDGFCQGVLLTYLPESKHMLIGLLVGTYQFNSWSYQASKIIIFGEDGMVDAESNFIKTCVFNNCDGNILSSLNLVGAAKLPDADSFMLKYNIKNHNKYVKIVGDSNLVKPSGAMMFVNMRKDFDYTGANVFVNDKFICKAPCSHYFDEGIYRINVRLNGYREYEDSLHVNRNHVEVIELGMDKSEN